MNEPTNLKDRRRRISKACDSCRQKKLKCDGIRPACSRCMQYDIACMYADVAKPPYRRSCRRIDNHSPASLDTSSTASIVSQAPLSTSTTSVQGEIPRYSQASREGSAPGDHQDTSSYQGLILGRPGDLRYFGPSTTFSSIFPRTRNKAERHPDAASFGKITASLRGGTFSRWVHPALQPLFGRTVHEPLPTWEQALSLVNDYFHHENRHWPLFDHPTFTAYLGRQYTDDPPPESSWWAALNIVLATAQRRKAGTDPSNWQEALNQAWKYVRNAMSAVLDILFHNISLLSVQALVSIGHFFLDTPNPQPTFILSSSAVRLGQAIGLHKQDCQSTHERTDQKQRARVFWCATILDQLACSKTGRPPAQKAEDYAVRLPEASEGETLGTCVSIDGKTVLENFRLDAHLTTIEADSFQRLYSAATPARKSPETQAAVEDLDRQLERWVRSIPQLHGLAEFTETTGQSQPNRTFIVFICDIMLVLSRFIGPETWRTFGPCESSRIPRNQSKVSVHRSRNAWTLPGLWCHYCGRFLKIGAASTNKYALKMLSSN